jgi:hypothetical protein
MGTVRGSLLAKLFTEDDINSLIDENGLVVDFWKDKGMDNEFFAIIVR